jgi:uncharacterized membrane protein YhhN
MMIRVGRFKNIFLEIFRSPKDIHRVISALFLSVTFSHIYFIVIETPKSKAAVLSIEYVLLGLVCGIMTFQVFWTFLSSQLNLKLYIRQFVVIGWGILAHRLGYGVEELGSKFVTGMLLLGWSIWIPFALSGMRFDELQTKIEAWQYGKKINSGDNVHDLHINTSDSKRSIL